MSKNYSKMTAVAKDVSATRYTHYTATSIANYLRSPVFGKHPKLVRKNTKAAAVEAAEIAAEAEGTACMEETKRLAAEYEAMGGGAGTEALAQAAELGDLLRERWSAHTLLRESDRRAARFGELMSVREAVATEMAATNAAVAAAATAAAAEAAAASKAAAAHEAAAKAAAAANERRALDVRTLSKKNDLPKELGGGAGFMDGEDFSWGAVFGVGARVRALAATASGLLPRLATGCGEAIVTAFDPRSSHARVHGEYLGLIFAAAYALIVNRIGISVWCFDYYDYISTAVVP